MKSLKSVYTLSFILLAFSTSVFAQNEWKDAVSQFREGNLEASKVTFKNLEKQKVKPDSTAYYLGRIYFDEGDFGTATKWFEKAYDRNNDSSEFALWVGRSFGRRAQSASKLKQPYLAKRTKKYFELATKLDGSNLEAREDLISYYVQAPGIMGGSVEKAFEQAEAIGTHDKVRGLLVKGNIYRDTDDDEKALASYEEALAADEKRTDAYYQLIGLHIQKENFEQANEYVNAVQEIDTVLTRPLYSRVNILWSQQKFEKVITVYEEIIQTDDSEFYPHYQIGRIASEQNIALDKGLKHLEIVLSHPNVSNDNFYPWAYYRMGKISEFKSDLSKAEEYYQKALDLDKDHKEAKEALKALN